MHDAVRLLILLATATAALAVLGVGCVWLLAEERRVSRSLRKVLGADPQAKLLARGQGRGIALDLAGGAVAVAWDTGAWCLIYAAEELMGAELFADGRVVARTYRGEARRALEDLREPQSDVWMRFIFDDAGYPDFELQLWRADHRGRDPVEALREANRWIARTEALLRRRGTSPGSHVVVQPSETAPWIEDDGTTADAPRAFS